MALQELFAVKRAFLFSNTKPCHCHIIFTIKSKLLVLLNHYIPRCPYYTVCFAFRRTGVHPPLAIS